MIKQLLLSVATVGITLLIMAQPPQSFKYQAVVRDGSDDLVSNQNVSFRLGILEGGPGGALLYSELHYVTTNDFGLAQLPVGDGSVISGVFEAIDWGAGSKYLKVECDPAGGSTFTHLGSSELHSVPYSLFSQRSADGYWEKSGNFIYYDGGFVGVGTNNPLTQLATFLLRTHSISSNKRCKKLIINKV
ncbi:MAG: hypothetical protein JW861_08690, partial [Bacteroidales bacterium]|nr:hypothetical protein [Bacteroidales bacterium]